MVIAMHRKSIIPLLATSFLLAPPVWAASLVEVPLGGATTLHFKGTAQQIIVGNPAIADVTVQSRRGLTVFGKYPGGTTLSVLDQNGTVIMQASVVVENTGAEGIAVHYGTGKNWTPGGAITTSACAKTQCSAAIALPTETVYKPGSGNQASPASNSSVNEK